MAQAGDIYRVALRMFGPANQDIMNIWHVELKTYVAGDDAAVADELNVRLCNAYQDLESSIATTQTSNDLSIVNVTTGAVLGSFAWSTAFGGVASGDELPPQTSLYSYFRTGFSRRIARKFWGVCSETLQDSGLTVPAVATAMATFLANFVVSWVGGTTGNTYEFGIYNDAKSPQFLPLTEAIVVGRLMTQRRRRPTVGS